MIANPEFRRNLWIQFTGTRVLIAFLLVGLLLLCALAVDFALKRQQEFKPDILAHTARWLTVAILLAWAGRLAAGAVVREIHRRTWDAQRLSTLRPWTMAWGKLFGATSLAWTMALICAAVYVGAELYKALVLARQLPDEVIESIAARVAAILGYGLVCQAAGLLGSLARLSGRPGERAGGATLAHVMGLVAVGLLVAYVEWGLEKEARWFGYPVGERYLRLATIWYFALWAVVGVYRRMRRELQMRSTPWAWLLFLASLIAYGEGLAYGRHPTVALLLPTAMAIVILWVLTLIEAKDPLTLRQCFSAGLRGHLIKAAMLVPLWLVTYVSFCLVAVASVVLATTGTEALRSVNIPGEATADTILIVVAALLFLTRDILIVQIFTLGRDGHLAGLYGAVFWFVLYFAIPSVIVVGQRRDLLGVVLPTGQGDWMLCLLPVAGEVVLCALLFAWRWHAYWRENAARSPTA